VRDHEEGSFEVGERLLDRLAGGDIQWFVRLVEHEDVGADEDGPRQLRRFARPPRGPRRGCPGRYARRGSAGAREDRVFGESPEAEEAVAPPFGTGRDLLVLGTPADFEARSDAEDAIVPGAPLHEVREEGRFTRPVRSHEAHPLPDADEEVRVLNR
jgi:hypothetical protein